MNFKRFQDEFDKTKWYDSILVGYDRCGSYDFCECCDKEERYPCAHAFHRKDWRKKGYICIARVRRRKK